MAHDRKFRFGVQFADPGSGDEWYTFAQRAEELGYSSLTVPDHYLGPGSVKTGVQTLAAVPAMAAAAAVTKTIQIGCRVFCIDFHHAATLVKEAATIDFLSNGRLEFGLGAGWVFDEYEALGLPFDPTPVRMARLTEMIQLVKSFFAGEELDINGEHIKVHGYKGTPISGKQPPLMIGGGAQKMLTLAARHADIVSLNFNNKAGSVTSGSIQSATAEMTDQRIQWIKDGAGARFDQIELEVGAYFTVVTDDADKAAGQMAGMFGVETDVMKSHPNALFGTVDQICDEIQSRRDRYGISYITVAGRNLEPFAPVVARLTGQ